MEEQKMKKLLAVIFAVLCLLSCTFMSVTASAKNYKKYENYVLLGDSSVSGFLDWSEWVGTFERVDGSFSAIVADTLGCNFYPRACQGFRTVEMRYIFEDDYEADKYLFAHTDYDQAMAMIPQIRQEVANADLITLGIGGNDFGAYLGWVINDILEEKEGNFDDLIELINKFVEEKGLSNENIDELIEAIDMIGHLDDFIEILPGALCETHRRYGENWDIMIQDIYDLNPDVDLLVIGIYNSGIKSEEDKNSDSLTIEIQNLLASLANTPMIEGAEKFGYIFVETNGTICDEEHPTPEGQKYLAQRVLDSLPNADFPYTDITYRQKHYLAVQYMFENELMDGKTETEFAPDEVLTKGVFDTAMNRLSGTDGVSDSAEKMSYLDVAAGIFRAANKDFTPMRFIKSVVLAFNIISDAELNIAASVTRAQGAQYIFDYINM